jgi:hypothetical protein
MQRSNYSPAARKKIACQLRERAAELDEIDIFFKPDERPQGCCGRGNPACYLRRASYWR